MQLPQSLSHSSPSMEGSTSGKRDDGVGAFLKLLACCAAAGGLGGGRRESEDGAGLR